MKLTNKGTFHSVHCSMIFRRAKIWSMHPLALRNPACSSRSLLSMASFILSRIILQNTLLGMERSVIPRQLSHFWRFPFLGTLTIRPLVQSLGMFSPFQIVWKRVVRALEDVSRSTFSISAWMESIPAALPVFKALMDFITSSVVGGPISMLRISAAAEGVAGFSGSGWFSTS